jgi:hypothetical protein
LSTGSSGDTIINSLLEPRILTAGSADYTDSSGVFDPPNPWFTYVELQTALPGMFRKRIENRPGSGEEVHLPELFKQMETDSESSCW